MAGEVTQGMREQREVTGRRGIFKPTMVPACRPNLGSWKLRVRHGDAYSLYGGTLATEGCLAVGAVCRFTLTFGPKVALLFDQAATELEHDWASMAAQAWLKATRQRGRYFGL